MFAAKPTSLLLVSLLLGFLSLSNGQLVHQRIRNQQVAEQADGGDLSTNIVPKDGKTNSNDFKDNVEVRKKWREKTLV